MPDIEVRGSFKNGGEILKACQSTSRQMSSFWTLRCQVLSGFDVVKRLQADDMPSIIFRDGL
jgi:hypothetical protein